MEIIPNEENFGIQDFRHVPFRCRCDSDCCRTVLWSHPTYQEQNSASKQLLVPLTDVQIKGVLEAGHATIDVQLTYQNLGTDSPIECTFEFPVDKQTLVSKIIAQIDDRVIEAEV